MKKIYIIYVGTELRSNKEDSIDRVWQYTNDIRRALKILKENITDIAESGFYKYAFLETVELNNFDVNGNTMKTHVYRFEKESNRYVRIGYFNNYLSFTDQEGFQKIKKEA